MSQSIVLDKAIKFALRIVKLYRHLTEEKKNMFLANSFLFRVHTSQNMYAKHSQEMVVKISHPICLSRRNVQRKPSFGC